MTERRCIWCSNVRNDGKSVVADPSITLIDALIQRAKSLNDGGLTEYAPFVDHASNILEDQKKNDIRYHWSSRQSVMKRRCAPSSGTNDPGLCSPPKVGRPSSS
jgi:hypothetical protein